MEIKNIIAKITIAASSYAIKANAWFPTTTKCVLIPLHDVNYFENKFTDFLSATAFLQTFFTVSFDYATEPPKGVIIIKEEALYEEVGRLMNDVIAKVFASESDEGEYEDENDESDEDKTATVILTGDTAFCLDAVASLLNKERVEVLDELLKDKLDKILVGKDSD